MFNFAQKNALEYPTREKPREKPREEPAAFQERTEPLTPNERLILENLTKVIKWFDALTKELHDSEAGPDLAHYARQFENGLAAIERPAQETEIVASAANADIVFLGDYHYLSKSQDFAAETIEKIAQASPRSSVLAVEFVEHTESGQRALDEYMSGKIGEEEFLKRIKFESWGMREHWPAYRHILESAQKWGVKVYGINTNRKEKNLARTDKMLAENIKHIAVQNPDSIMMIHIGEDHVSEDHLPREMSSLDAFGEKKYMAVLQNLSSVYFAALKKYKDFYIPPSVKLHSRSYPVYHVMTAPLLTKLVANIEYLQSKERPRSKEGDDEPVEFLSTDAVYMLAKSMADVVGLKQRKDEYVMVPPTYSSEFEIRRQLYNLRKRPIFEPYIKILEEKGSVYVPGSKDGKHSPALIIQRFRLKRFLEELATFALNPDGTVEEFARLSPAQREKLQVFQYVCSKIFIPERTAADETEKKGDGIFGKFLAGKQIEIPKIEN